jgi:hypothetical protein
MSMRSTHDPDTQLFMAVDECTYGSYAVTFTVHRDRMAEATSLIPLLNIVMEAKFGASIWEWFTDTAKDASQGYVYDAILGRLKNMDKEADAKKTTTLSLNSPRASISPPQNPPTKATPLILISLSCLRMKIQRINMVIPVVLSHSNQPANPSGPLTLPAATKKTTTIPTI